MAMVVSMGRWIRCRPETKNEFQDVIKAWPELNALVHALRNQDMFPGMRNIRIRDVPNEEAPADPLAEKLQALKASEHARKEALQKKMDQLSGGVDAP